MHFLTIEQITRRERVLLILSGIFITLNQVTFIIVRDLPWNSLWMIGVWVGCAVGVHQVLMRQLPNRDPYLLPAIYLLCGWGINIIYRLQPRFGERQTWWMVVSSLAFITLMFLPHDLYWLRRYRYTWLVLGLGLLIITILLGVNPAGDQFNPPRLWLRFVDEIYYQPAELIKILLVAFMASYLADHWMNLRNNRVFVGRFKLPSLSFITPILLMWGLTIVILIWQRDLGTATIFFVVFMVMLYLASGQALLLLGGGVLLLGASVLAYYVIDVVALRIDIWLNPWADSSGQAFQIVQSLMAVSAGGIVGQGIGQGLPTAIPVVHSDFAFAAIAEEWGFIGVLGVLMTLLLIVLRGIRIAILSQHRPFMALLAAGLSVVLATQSLIIMGGTLRLWPLTGVTLPFISYGGSSLLTVFTMVGLLLILSDQERVR